MALETVMKFQAQPDVGSVTGASRIRFPKVSQVTHRLVHARTSASHWRRSWGIGENSGVSVAHNFEVEMENFFSLQPYRHDSFRGYWNFQIFSKFWSVKSNQTAVCQIDWAENLHGFLQANLTGWPVWNIPMDPPLRNSFWNYFFGSIYVETRSFVRAIGMVETTPKKN